LKKTKEKYSKALKKKMIWRRMNSLNIIIKELKRTIMNENITIKAILNYYLNTYINYL
jgi:hypothetical protein